MKKFAFILAALAMVGVACNKQENDITPVTPEDNTTDMVRIELKVSVAPETRAAMVGKVLTFGKDDEIAILVTTGGTTTVETLTAESVDSGTGVITFSTTVPSDAEIGDYAYYPAEIIADNGSGIVPTRIVWPSMINGDAVQIPMMAEIDLTNNTAEFMHLGCMLKVNLVNVPTDADGLEFNTSNGFGGWYNVNTSDWSISNVDPSSWNKVWMSISGDGEYYIPIPAGSYGDFQLAMMSNFYQYYLKQRTANIASPITPGRGQIVNLGDFTYDVDEIAEWYMVSKLQATPWSLSDNSIRFIKIGDNEYRATTNNANDSGDFGYKVISGSDLGTSDWTKTYGAQSANNYSGSLVLNGNNCYYGAANEIYSATINMSSMSYGNLYVSGASSFVFDTIDMVGDFNEWSTSSNYKRFTKTAAHNWKLSNLLVGSNSTVEFKIIANSQWDYGNWGGVAITDSKPYGTATYRDNGAGDTARDSYLLTPGAYDVYFNDAKGDIMFVKLPYDPSLTPMP